ncbi:MAG: hypothetical protein ACJA1F_000637 [Paracoccaceae bacterium]|jgi:hypothetical protein
MFSPPIPRAALVLGLSGLLPFLWGLGTLVNPLLYDLTMRWVGPRFVAPYVLLSYGTVILCFMSGVLWGMATRATGHTATIGYVLSVIPALWAFFFVGNGPTAAAINLIAGFLAVLAIDWLFWTNGLAPEWWMKLRIILTAVVVISLGFIAGGG